MKPDIFASNIATLNAFYVNFKLDTSSELVMDVWYNFFKEMDDQEFTDLVKHYMIHNIYPPQSPAHLLEHYKKTLIEHSTTAEKAWNDMLELRQKRAFMDYNAVMGTRYLIEEMIEHFEDNGQPAIARTMERLKDDLRVGVDDNKRTWVKKAFIDIYNQEVKNVVSNRVVQIAMQSGTKFIK